MSRDFLLTADRLFDGDSLVIAPAFLHLRGREVVGVGVRLRPEWVGLPRFDHPGCTLLPGLIDTHVHLVFSARDSNAEVIEQVTSESDELLLGRATRNAHAALRAGITTLRDCGCRGTVVQTLRDRIEGGVVGPTVLSCGPPITTRTGHCHWLGCTADTQDEVDGVIDDLLAAKVDFLKVMATGGNMTAGSDPMSPQYDDATLALVADRGRRAGLHAAAHVLSRSALPGVVAANFRTIEHCDWRVTEWRYEFDEALARRILEQGQFVGLTFSGLARRAVLPQAREANDAPSRRLNDRFASERRLLDVGVRFTLHSDAGVRWTPIEQFALGLRAAEVELGLTPHEVLRAVMSSAAEAINRPERGRLAVGKRADVLVVAGDPLRDLAALEQVRAVWKDGTAVELNWKP